MGLCYPDRVEAVQLQPVHGLGGQQRTELRAVEWSGDAYCPQNISETHTQSVVVL